MFAVTSKAREVTVKCTSALSPGYWSVNITNAPMQSIVTPHVPNCGRHTSANYIDIDVFRGHQNLAWSNLYGSQCSTVSVDAVKELRLGNNHQQNSWVTWSNRLFAPLRQHILLARDGLQLKLFNRLPYVTLPHGGHWPKWPINVSNGADQCFGRML